MIRVLTIALCTAVLSAAAPVSAEPVDGKTARDMVFKLGTPEVRVYDDPALSETDRQILQTVGRDQKFYAVIAFSPDQGLLSDPLVAAANYHGLDDARVAALAACNERRERNVSPCRVAAEVVPKGWEPRALQLNVDATVSVGKDYRRARAPKAIAISDSTGHWGFASGDGAQEAALKTCGEQAGASDCRIVIVD